MYNFFLHLPTKNRQSCPAPLFLTSVLSVSVVDWNNKKMFKFQKFPFQIPIIYIMSKGKKKQNRTMLGLKLPPQRVWNQVPDNWLHSKNVKMLSGDLGREKCLCDGLMLVLQSERTFLKKSQWRNNFCPFIYLLDSIDWDMLCGKHYGRQCLKGTWSGSPCGKVTSPRMGTVSPRQWEKEESRRRAFLFCGPATFSLIHTCPGRDCDGESR